MAEYTVDLNINVYNDRNAVRMAVVEELSKEVPGEGKEAQASRYTYYVEKLSNGNRIYLRRPANLHNGFDFIVCVENYNFNPSSRKRNYPTHDDIIQELRIKKQENKSKYEILFSVINKVFRCERVTEDEMIIDFDNGCSTEMIVKTLKWLFIEQDIRYWNYSGRNMLWNAICEV